MRLPRLRKTVSPQTAPTASPDSETWPQAEADYVPAESLGNTRRSDVQQRIGFQHCWYGCSLQLLLYYFVALHPPYEAVLSNTRYTMCACTSICLVRF